MISIKEQNDTYYQKEFERSIHQKDALDICIQDDIFILNRKDINDDKSVIERKESVNSIVSSWTSLKQSSNLFNLSGLIYKSKFNHNRDGKVDWEILKEDFRNIANSQDESDFKIHKNVEKQKEKLRVKRKQKQS